MAKNPNRHGSISPEFALLGFLCLQSSHGYDLHQQLTNGLGFVWHISQSQTYNILNRLEMQGDISSTMLAQEKLPPRQVLQITQKGRERFDHWMDMPDSQSIEINAAISKLESSLAEIPADQTINRLSLQLRIRQLHSALDWLNECRKALA